jgi:hypothetical protein
MNNPQKEIVQYLRHGRGDNQYITGVMVAFKDEVDSETFKIGYSLKAKEDWALYAYPHPDATKETASIIGCEFFDKQLALQTARNRAIKWEENPDKAHFKTVDGQRVSKASIPPSMAKDFILFLDRARRYYKVDKEFFPEWIPNSVKLAFDVYVQHIFDERQADKARMVESLKKQHQTYKTKMLNIEKQVQVLTLKTYEVKTETVYSDEV